jgi:hypothetical protein
MTHISDCSGRTGAKHLDRMLKVFIQNPSSRKDAKEFGGFFCVLCGKLLSFSSAAGWNNQS